jgi:hypothetical protein
MMTWSATDDSGHAGAWAIPTRVDTRRGNQIMPWMSSDYGAQTINIGYLTAERDLYDHRYQLFQTQIKPGEHAARPPKVVSELPDEPAADPFAGLFSGGTFGGYIGMALARLEQLHPYGVAVSAPGQNSYCVTRYFAPSSGIPEDPVTGSIHCALVPYGRTG